MPAIERESRKPIDSAFYQQRLRAWKPLMTPRWVVLTFLTVGILFCVIGAIILSTSSSVKEISARYDHLLGMPRSVIEATDADSLCPWFINVGANQTCLALHIVDEMTPPVYFYYKLTNFYQNHRRFVKSRSDTQLRAASSITLDTCDPLRRNSNGDTLYPCGLIASSAFNDTFQATFCTTNSTSLSTCMQLSNDDPDNGLWRKRGIAWSADREKKFVWMPDYMSLGWSRNTSDGRLLPRVDDEDLMVWMRTASLPTFKKLHRVINMTLPAGSTIYLQINDVYPVASFDGEKHVVLTTTSWLGGKNLFLGWAYIAVGLACVLFAMLFAAKQLVDPRPLGDLNYFKWRSGGGGSNSAGGGGAVHHTQPSGGASVVTAGPGGGQQSPQDYRGGSAPTTHAYTRS